MPPKKTLEVSLAVYNTLLSIAHRERRTLGEILGDALLMYEKEFPAEEATPPPEEEIFVLKRRPLTWRRLAAKYCTRPKNEHHLK